MTAAAAPIQRWRCRNCADADGESYVYPPDADAYCSTCGAPLSAEERVAAALAALVRAPAANTDKPLLTSNEAAALLGTTKRGLEGLRRRGKFARAGWARTKPAVSS